jgi:hypothetical protein
MNNIVPGITAQTHLYVSGEGDALAAPRMTKFNARRCGGIADAISDFSDRQLLDDEDG